MGEEMQNTQIIAAIRKELVIIGAGVDEETHKGILLRKHVEILKCFCENCKEQVESYYKYCPFCGKAFVRIVVPLTVQDFCERMMKGR